MNIEKSSLQVPEGQAARNIEKQPKESKKDRLQANTTVIEAKGVHKDKPRSKRGIYSRKWVSGVS